MSTVKSIQSNLEAIAPSDINRMATPIKNMMLPYTIKGITSAIAAPISMITLPIIERFMFVF